VNVRRVTTRRSWLALVALVTAGALGASSCSGDDQDSQAEPGFEHVHGLGIDPATGQLYAATHFGLFRLSADGSPRRVGDNYQDTMGFTVVGPSHFLGSGHPDLDQDLPPLLGLIESVDAGRSWQSISLLGEADFHALSFRHGNVYGYDATSERFMVSTDQRTWDTRSQPTGLISFAVDPQSPDHVIAATTTGLLSSTDGGRAWQASPAPPLAFLSWSDDGTLAAAGADSRAYIASQNGIEWTEVGVLPGFPEALLVDGQTMFAAIQSQGVYESRDGGHTWQPRGR